MKTNYGLLYFIFLVLGFAFSGCDDSEEPTGQDDNSDDVEQMYFPPVGSGDWKTVSADQLSWDSASFNDALQFAKEKRATNLMIVYKGRIVAEEYWRDTDATTLRDVNSVAKSMMGFVIGILQQNGTINLNDKVSDYLDSGWSQSPNTESDITIHHLLTMTSGLNEDLQSVGTPGQVWRYSHAAYKMLYEVIKSATDASARDYFNKVLFSEIGAKYDWNGYDVQSNARDLVRFGHLIMNDGVWNGKKLLEDEGYFAEMLRPSQTLQPAYGYLWWLNGTDTWYDDDTRTTFDGSIVPSMPSDALLAKGFHDQRIYIVPSLDLIVVRQGEFTGMPESGEGSFDDELWKRIMAAVNGGALN